MNYVIGVDPGLDGAIALIRGSSVQVWDCPWVKAKKGREFDVAQMAEIVAVIDSLVAGNAVASVIERGIAMPKQASNTTYKQGRGQGIWEGLLAQAGFAFELITPQSWKKSMGLSGQPKDASRAKAAALYPSIREQLKRKKDDGRAEAVLIAEHRRRQG